MLRESLIRQPYVKRNPKQWFIVASVFMMAACLIMLPVAPRDFSPAMGKRVHSMAACSPIALENQQPGTDSWILTNPADDTNNQIKGFVSDTSVNVGDDIAFHVSVDSPQSYTIELYRMGWYAGLGGRLMHDSGTLSGTTQPGLVIDATTGLIEAPWDVDYTLTIPSTWVSGVYLAKLTNATGFENYIPFVVRDDSRTADLLYQRPDMTDQAYNNYPNDGATGKSLYDFNSYGSNTVATDKRAVKVSFDRPYADDGSGLFFEWEFDLIRWLERNGYDVAYSTSHDTHLSSSNILNYQGFISPAHDEYWSFDMRTGVDAARDGGVNMAFLGANTAYIQVRMEDSTAAAATASGNPVRPDRTLVSYKNWGLDPITDNTLKTYLWRSIWYNGGFHAEQELIGIQYVSFGDFNQNTDYVVSNSNHWIYANTGLADGDRVADLVGYEVDQQDSSHSLPANQSYTLLSASPYTTAYGTNVTANSVIYQAPSPSNAWVFGSGTMSWSWGLDRTGYVDGRIQQTMANLFNQFVGGAPSCTNLPTPTPTAPVPAATATPIPVTAPVNGFAHTAYVASPASESYASASSDAALGALDDVGANWVAILPTWYQEDIDATQIFYDYTITPSDADVVHAITEAHAQGLKVLLKPHIDLRMDPTHWRGQIGTNFSTADWAEWFAEYQTLITHYADLAETHGVEMFAVGTELVATTQRTAEWRGIIGDVRSRYSGPITYAANHSGEDAHVAFWDDLDVIGIDAYYPITSDDNSPTLAEIESSWAPRESFMASLASTYEKPILFTEIGYPSADGANQMPWCYGCGGAPDLQEQADAYQAVFNVFSSKPWFLGTIWWEWEIDAVAGSPCDDRYTPFDKPAENVIRGAFGVATRPEIGNPCPPVDTTELLAPTGTINQGAPPFEWTAVANASDYRMVVYDTVGEAIVFDDSYMANTVCGAATCTTTPANLSLANGSYRWLILPLNSYGDGVWTGE